MFIVFTLWFSSFYLSACERSSHVYLLAFRQRKRIRGARWHRLGGVSGVKQFRL